MAKDDYEIDGSEYVKFRDSSSAFAEKLLGFHFEKDQKREIKTIANYLIHLNRKVKLVRTSVDSFNVYVFEGNDKRKIMSLEVFNDSYVSDNFKNSAYEEHIRQNKVKDISQLIDFIYDKFKDKSLITCEQNFTRMLNDYAIERKLQPHELLFRRIQNIIAYCKKNHISNISDNDVVKEYLGNYLTMLLIKLLKNPTDTFDYILGLQLPRYLARSQYMNFEIILKTVLGMLTRKEKVPFDRTATLMYEFEQLENCLHNYINIRIRNYE